MFPKSLILVFLLIFAAHSVPQIKKRNDFIVTTNGNDLFIGGRVEGDYQVTQYLVSQPAVEDQVVTKTLQISTAYEITFIAAYDKSGNELPAPMPILVNGGPGSKEAELLFTSEIGQLIYYWVDVYVRR